VERNHLITTDKRPGHKYTQEKKFLKEKSHIENIQTFTYATNVGIGSGLEGKANYIWVLLDGDLSWVSLLLFFILVTVSIGYQCISKVTHATT